NVAPQLQLERSFVRPAPAAIVLGVEAGDAHLAGKGVAVYAIVDEQQVALGIGNGTARLAPEHRHFVLLFFAIVAGKIRQRFGAGRSIVVSGKATVDETHIVAERKIAARPHQHRIPDLLVPAATIHALLVPLPRLRMLATVAIALREIE